MLSQGISADLPLRGEMPQGMDMQQFMMALDPTNNRGLQSLYMPQMGMSNGSPSPSSLPSSGSASTTGPNTAENGALDSPSKAASPTMDQNNQMAAMGNIFALMNSPMNQNMAALLEQINQQTNMQNMQNMAAQMFNPLAAFGAHAMNTPSKMLKKKPNGFDESPMKNNALHFGFPFPMTPSTSTASQQSVIVSNDRDDVTPPAQKRSRQEDEEDIKPSLDLFASMVGGTRCDECGKECGNQLSLFTHKATEHMDHKPSSPGTLKCNECDKEFESSQYLEQHKMMNHGGMNQRHPHVSPALSNLLAGMNLPPGFPTLNFMLPNMPQQFGMDFDPAQAMAQLNNTPKQQQQGVKRQYSSNGKNYCDLCNKEVCNKYFLRTHMLKMHGIVIDENKTMIANIDTLEKERMGAISFRCDICHTELKSRNLLRQHKQENHGVLPLASASRKSMPSTPSMVMPGGMGSSMTTTPLSSNGSEQETKCPLCQRTVLQNQLANHFQIDHAGDFGGLGGLEPPPSPTVNCKMENQINCHSMQEPANDFFSQIGQMKEETRDIKPDPNTLRCNQCGYSTKEPRNLEMHLERHERMNEVLAKQQPEDEDDDALQRTAEVARQMAAANQMDGEHFNCLACDVSYSDEASLDAHAAVAHNGINLTVRKKVDEEKALERNSHTSGSISPSTESLPEGFAKVPTSCDKPQLYQSFILKTNDAQGNLLGEIVARLPVKALLAEPTRVMFELVPQPQQQY